MFRVLSCFSPNVLKFQRAPPKKEGLCFNYESPYATPNLSSGYFLCLLKNLFFSFVSSYFSVNVTTQNKQATRNGKHARIRWHDKTKQTSTVTVCTSVWIVRSRCAQRKCNIFVWHTVCVFLFVFSLHFGNNFP